jgi:transposase
VPAAPVKHAAETGWKQQGRRRWLWLACTATGAVFLIHARRRLAALTLLLGEHLQGIWCSDRWSTYNHVSKWQRQVCWAHRQRDVQKCVDGGGAAADVGRVGLTTVSKVFRAWHLFRGGGCDRSRRQRRLRPVARRLAETLRQGCGCAAAPVAKFCATVLELAPALWQCVVTAGVEPTNNQAERVRRRAVLWRQRSFGCSSAAGCRFVERLLTVVQTWRWQGRQVLQFLAAALVAYRQGQVGPKLIPT